MTQGRYVGALGLLLVCACAGCAGQSATDVRLRGLEERTAALERSVAVRDAQVTSLDERTSATDATVDDLRERVGRLEAEGRAAVVSEREAAGTMGGRKVYPATSRPSSKASSTKPVARAVSATRPAAKPVATAAGGASAAYKEALALLERGRPEEARQRFDAFIEAYPSDALQPNAHYWRGEALYAQRRYADAIIDFKDVVASYPKHQKASDSLLKAGMAYQRLNDEENARLQFKALQEQYPATPAAALARKRGMLP